MFRLLTLVSRFAGAKQLAERNNVSASYVARSEKFMWGVEIREQMISGHPCLLEQ
jgi:hypothetical protein